MVEPAIYTGDLAIGKLVGSIVPHETQKGHAHE